MKSLKQIHNAVARADNLGQELANSNLESDAIIIHKPFPYLERLGRSMNSSTVTFCPTVCDHPNVLFPPRQRFQVIFRVDEELFSRSWLNTTARWAQHQLEGGSRTHV